MKKNTLHKVENYYIIPSECKFMIIQCDLFDMNDKKYNTKIDNFDPDIFSTKVIINENGIPMNFKLKCGIRYNHKIKHYTAYIKDLSEKSWIHVDSLEPTRVKKEELNTSLEDIYGLVFEKI
jgi:hypothetical protein